MKPILFALITALCIIVISCNVHNRSVEFKVQNDAIYTTDSDAQSCSPKKYLCYAPGRRRIRRLDDSYPKVDPMIMAGDSSLPKLNKKLLITIHVTEDSLGNPAADAGTIAQIKDAIRATSEYFTPIHMSFEASDQDVNLIDDFQYDIIEEVFEMGELEALHGVEDRLNLFVIRDWGGDIAGAACGFGGGTSVWVAAYCVTPELMAHELGHVFGLPHTFGGGNVLADFTPSLELVDGSNCETEGDAICDTPADPYDPTSEEEYFDDCAYVFDGTDANGDYYDPDPGNIMAYYDEPCACGTYFTKGQLRVVASNYLNNKLSLW